MAKMILEPMEIIIFYSYPRSVIFNWQIVSYINFFCIYIWSSNYCLVYNFFRWPLYLLLGNRDLDGTFFSYIINLAPILVHYFFIWSPHTHTYIYSVCELSEGLEKLISSPTNYLAKNSQFRYSKTGSTKT